MNLLFGAENLCSLALDFTLHTSCRKLYIQIFTSFLGEEFEALQILRDEATSQIQENI